MSIVDNSRLIIKVCELYYVHDMSQKEISATLGVSRPQISRILAAAKERGIVNITINNPFSREAEIERRLVKKYGIKDASVLNVGGATSAERLAAFGNEAAPLIEDYVPQDTIVGLMSGTTVKTIVDSLPKGTKKLKMTVPLVGAINTSEVENHANSIARRIARFHNSPSMTLNAPAYVSDAELAKRLKEEGNIRKVLDMGRKCNVCVVGIGNLTMTATNIREQGLTEEDLRELKEEGAVASVCCSYLNAEGQEVGQSIIERSIGLTLKELKKSRLIAAAIGASKVKAIDASLKSGYIDVLVTNLVTAKGLLEDAEENMKEE